MTNTGIMLPDVISLARTLIYTKTEDRITQAAEKFRSFDAHATARYHRNTFRKHKILLRFRW